MSPNKSILKKYHSGDKKYFAEARSTYTNGVTCARYNAD